MAHQKFTEHDIVPGVIGTAPVQTLQVSSQLSFANHRKIWNINIEHENLLLPKNICFHQVKYHFAGFELEVNLGGELKPRQVKDEPEVRWTAKDGEFFTVSMIGTLLFVIYPSTKFSAMIFRLFCYVWLLTWLDHSCLLLDTYFICRLFDCLIAWLIDYALWILSPCDYINTSTDPDPTDPKNRDINHWLVVNIPGNKIEDGNVLAGYRGSKPPEGTGKYRICFVWNADTVSMRY